MSAPNSKQAPVAPHARPYKDFLNAEFHRRFVRAFGITACVCYLVAILTGPVGSIWALSPFGYTGIRALTLVLSTLFVYIIRAARSHIGDFIPSTPKQALQQVLGLQTIFVLMFYFLSAAAFIEAYVFFGGNDMGPIEKGRAHERDRVNERPVFLRTIVYLFLVPTQTIWHVVFDHDKVQFGQLEESAESTKFSAQALGKRIVNVVNHAFWFALCIVVGGSAVYVSTFLRYVVWRIAYSMFSIFLPKSTGPGRFPHSGAVHAFGSTFFIVYLIVVLWTSTNITFNFYMSKEPLKRGQPLTNDSKDQNGSLVSGIRSKRELPRSFAFWELALITQRFQPRRQSIYDDYSRGAWNKILEACIHEINQITKRVDATKPAPPAAPVQAAPIEALPRIAQPMKDGNILNPNAPPSTRLNAIGAFAKQQGSSPRKELLGPSAVKMIEYGRDKVIPPAAQAELQQKGLAGIVSEALTPLIRAPYIGPYLQVTFARKANMVITGSPYSRLSAILSATQALSNLAVHSLQEDKYGQVAPHVGTIVRTFAAAIKSIQTFMATAQPHWTDVEFKETNRNVPEVQAILKRLRKGLEDVLIAHAEFLENEGLKKSEIRDARELVSSSKQKEVQPVRAEMEQVR